jgi:hypothetical protein
MVTGQLYASDAVSTGTNCRGGWVGPRAGLVTMGNRVLRIFGLKLEVVTGGTRKLHNEELHNVYFSSDIRAIKSKMRWIVYGRYKKCIQNFDR